MQQIIPSHIIITHTDVVGGISWTFSSSACVYHVTVDFLKQQKAQLPLRNRASAMHFFLAKLLSIAVMTYTYVYYQRNLRPMIRPICYAHSE